MTLAPLGVFRLIAIPKAAVAAILRTARPTNHWMKIGESLIIKVPTRKIVRKVISSVKPFAPSPLARPLLAISIGGALWL